MPRGPDPQTTMFLAPWGPWLQLTQTAFDAWIGVWTAALPQRQAELVLQWQRQALETLSAPLAWAAPAAELQTPPAPRPAAPHRAPPAKAPSPATAEPAPQRPEGRDMGEAGRSIAEPAGASEPEAPPPRPRKAARPAAELRQSRTRKALPKAGGKRSKTRR